ncbi:MAG: hypothetical protein EHM18_18970, partial [Acidobacteria bacterium]
MKSLTTFVTLGLAAVLCFPLEAGAQTTGPQEPTTATERSSGVAGLRTEFKVKYLAEGAAYLDSGRNAGLIEGHKLTVKRAGDNGESLIAELVVVSVASTSAVCEIKPVSGELQVGDTARLAPEVVEELKTRRAAADSLKYPQVVSFTEEDPLEAELREYVPRPPLQEINRARGRIGFEYNGIRDHSSSVGSSQLGLVLRADVTRLGGSYWNFNGYYRGRVHSRNRSGNETLTDLINRT